MNTMAYSRMTFFSSMLCILAASCGDSNADTSGMKQQSSALPEVSVRIEEVRLRPFVETLHLTGTIKASDDIILSPEEGGIVKEWKYRKGSSVSAGAYVVVLSDEIPRASYDAALAQFKSAELTYEKQQRVFAEQAVSEWQLKTALYGRDAAKAQADLARARWERTRIKTPVTGILDDRYVDEGEMAPPGQPIARIVNISQVKIAVNVPERYAGGITRGTPLHMSVQAYGSQEFSGTVSFVGAAISPDNRTFPVEATLSNPGGKLRPEMIGRVEISLSDQKRALLLDEQIVQQVDRNKFVVYVEENGRAMVRTIQLGARQDNLVEITRGLKAGDKVITSGFREVADGQPVRVAP